MFHVSSSFAQMRTNWTLSPVAEENLKKLPRSWLEVLQKSDHCRWMWIHHYNPKVKVKRGCEEGSKRIRKFGSRIRLGRSNWWCFSIVRGWFINISVLPSRELMVNITQQFSSNCWCTSTENIQSWSAIGSSIRITHLPIRHIALQNILEEHSLEVMKHTSYSLNIAPCKFWLFPALKKALRGWQFHSDRD